MSPRVPMPWRASRRRIARDVGDEIAGHLELGARELERDGVPPDEAWERTVMAFGRQQDIRDECHAIQRRMLRRRERMMRVEDVWVDVRWAVRSLLRAPGFTVFAGLTLALGIAANTSIFSVATGLFFRSLPGIRSPETLVEISRGPGFISVSHPMYERFRDQARGLEGLAAFDMVGISLDAGDGRPEVVMGLQVSGDYFDVLGTRPAAGRFFLGRERDPAAGLSVAVLTHRMWSERFGADPSIVGSSVRLNGQPVTIVGVAEEGFGGHIAPARAQLFMPLGSPLPGFHGMESLRSLDTEILELVGRVAPGTDGDALAADLARLADARLTLEGAPRAPYVAEVRPFVPVPGAMRGPAGGFFMILAVLVGLLLLIACLNVAGLLIARAHRRRREVAVRMSLGAGRARLIRQLLVESLALSALAGIGGVVLTYWITGALSAFQLPVAPFPGLELDLQLTPNGTVLAYSVVLGLGVALVFGLLPALRATRPDLVTDLKGGAVAGGLGRGRLQEILVAGQMAGSIVLLAGSGLFVRALVAAETLDLGFNTHDVYVASFDLELAGRDAGESWPFYAELRRRALDLPGVEHATVASKLPMAGLSQMAPVNFEGVDAPPGSAGFTLANQSVGPGYFATLEIPILQGRSFTEADDRGGPPVVVVNQALADRMWPGTSPLGRSVTTLEASGQTRGYSVVGVAADAKYRRPTDGARPFAYFAAAQRPRTDMVLEIRTVPGGGPPFREIVALASELEPAAAALSTGSLESAMALFLLPQRAGAWVTGVVGLFGLLLSGLGVYALTAFSVATNLRELGVRMALGADGSSVLSGVVRRGIVAPLVGGLVGLAVAVTGSRFLEAFLFGVHPLDPVAFGSVVAALAIASLAANLVPAARAARMDPARVLRTD